MVGKRAYGVLIGVLIAGMLISACGGAKPAGQPSAPEATSAPTAVPTQAALPPTQAKQAPTPTVKAEDEVQSALDNVVKLAPVHLVSSFSIKKGDKVETQNRVEADIDAKGNQHLILTDMQADEKVQLYIVDKKLYLGTEQDGKTVYMQVGDAGDSLVAALTVYGGAALAFLNDMEGAKKVGSESVNGFQADKYEFKINAANLGLAGLAAQAQGASYDLKSYAWIEPKSQALVRSRVDWTWKEAKDQVASEFHQELDVTKGTVQEIKAPENILQLGG